MGLSAISLATRRLEPPPRRGRSRDQCVRKEILATSHAVVWQACGCMHDRWTLALARTPASNSMWALRSHYLVFRFQGVWCFTHSFLPPAGPGATGTKPQVRSDLRGSAYSVGVSSCPAARPTVLAPGACHRQARVVPVPTKLSVHLRRVILIMSTNIH